jgi:hypothetical protein
MDSTLQRGEFQDIERALIREILEAKPVNRGTWHAQKAPAPTRELRHVRLIMPVPMFKNSLVRRVSPNMPWAEQQFQERVSGAPLNPPPSHASWPFAEKSNDRHVDENGQFSHTYPERYWPKLAGRPLDSTGGHFGIRYEYGDLKGLVDILRQRSHYSPGSSAGMVSGGLDRGEGGAASTVLAFLPLPLRRGRSSRHRLLHPIVRLFCVTSETTFT